MSRLNSNFVRRIFFWRNIGVSKIYETGRNYSKVSSNWIIRNITEVDIPRIAEFRKSPKRQDCLHSLYSFHKLDPEAIIVAEDDNGNIIGTHSMLIFAKGLYVSGLTYVHRNYRGSNLAFQLIRKGMERHRQKNRIVGFTFKKWANMASYLAGMKMEVGFSAQEYVSTEIMPTSLLSNNLPGDTTIHLLGKKHLELIYDYDLQVAGYERRTFLDLSFNEPHCKTLIALKNERCVGYGSFKLTVWGAKRVGPLYADDSEIAEALLKSLLEGFPQGKGVAVVIPSANSEALKFVNKSNIPFSEDLYQVHEDGVPQSDMLKVYALFDVSGTSI